MDPITMASVLIATSPTGLMRAGATQTAMIGAAVKFQGRDWRRVKRELRKAAKSTKHMPKPAATE
jgi:hypothetical protein